MQLLESGRQNSRTRKLGLDMLRQLSLHEDYVLLLVQDGYYLEALRYARKHKVMPTLEFEERKKELHLYQYTFQFSCHIFFLLIFAASLYFSWFLLCFSSIHSLALAVVTAKPVNFFFLVIDATKFFLFVVLEAEAFFKIWEDYYYCCIFSTLYTCFFFHIFISYLICSNFPKS